MIKVWRVRSVYVSEHRAYAIGGFTWSVVLSLVRRHWWSWRVWRDGHRAGLEAGPVALAFWRASGQ